MSDTAQLGLGGALAALPAQLGSPGVIAGIAVLVATLWLLAKRAQADDWASLPGPPPSNWLLGHLPQVRRGWGAPGQPWRAGVWLRAAVAGASPPPPLPPLALHAARVPSYQAVPSQLGLPGPHTRTAAPAAGCGMPGSAPAQGIHEQTTKRIRKPSTRLPPPFPPFPFRSTSRMSTASSKTTVRRFVFLC